jgi:hypothetical protein
MGIEAVCAVAHGPLRGDYSATSANDTAFRPKGIHLQSNWPDVVDLDLDSRVPAPAPVVLSERRTPSPKQAALP